MVRQVNISKEQLHRPVLFGYFKSMSEQLYAQYRTSRLQRAAKNRGDNRELFCANFLSRSLPPRLIVHQGGEVWDSQAARTGELDVVVVRHDAPRLPFGSKEAFLAEGVFAVVEVKSKLTSSKLREALDTLARVKALHIEPSSGMFLSNSLGRPLRIVFSYEGATAATLGKVLQSYSDSDVVDMICILDSGVLLASGRLVKWNNAAPFFGLHGGAAALGFLYYYLATYGSGFLARSVSIQAYFTPFSDWVDEG